MSLRYIEHIRLQVLSRRFGRVLGHMACALMLATAAAHADEKVPDASPLRVEKVRVKELRDKKPEKVKTQDTMRRWRDATPHTPPQRAGLENALLIQKLHGDIVKQIEPCWHVPVGAPNAEELKVTLRVFLLPDGALADVPEIVDGQHGQDKFHRIAAERARRAVQRCAPLKLPAETYDIWRQIELVFDPSMMLGHQAHP
jgi:hypothetical protein